MPTTPKPKPTAPVPVVEPEITEPDPLTLLDPDAATEIVGEILVERAKQDYRWGEQNHPDGTGYPYYRNQAEYQKQYNDQAVALGNLTWRDILLEEVYEALEQDTGPALREELVQVAAVAAGWVEAYDRSAALRASVDAELQKALELQQAEEELGATEG